MILGADSEAKPPKEKPKGRSQTTAMLNYFSGMSGRALTFPQRAALLSGFSRLLEMYDARDVKHYVDRYFAHPSSKGARFPFSFLSYDLQEKLIEGRKLTHNDVDAWIDNEFERTKRMVLPWSPHEDAEIKLRILRNPELKDEILDEYFL